MNTKVVRVRFRCCREVAYGDQVCVIGSSRELGKWGWNRALCLYTNSKIYPIWTNEVPLLVPKNSVFEYRYVVKKYDGNVVHVETPEQNRICNCELQQSEDEIVLQDDHGLYEKYLLLKEIPPSHSETSTSDELPVIEPPRLPTTEKKRTPSLTDSYTGTVFIVSIHLPWIIKKKPVSITAKGDPIYKWRLKKTRMTFRRSLYQLRDMYPQTRIIFVGFCGVMSAPRETRHLLTDLLWQKDCIPVFVEDENVFREYYNFCNEFLSPFLHNHVLHHQMNPVIPNCDSEDKFQKQYQTYRRDMHDFSTFRIEHFTSYKFVNRSFAETLVPHLHEQDLVWVNDYHLYMLPQYLTRKIRNANIALYIHTPWPSSDIFRCLPCREEILRAALCADLIGFQFYDYAKRFVICCHRLLGCESEFQPEGVLEVEYNGRKISMHIAHTGVVFNWMHEEMLQERVSGRAASIREKYAKDRVFLVGYDKCHRFSGLFLKLSHFSDFCEAHGEEVKKRLGVRGITLVQHAYGEPTSSVIVLQELLIKLSNEINQKLKKLSNDSEDPDFQLVLHLHDTSHSEKLALFKAADVLIDSSVRNGLNLSPFEFTTCHELLRPGRLVLSEFSGCSRVLVGGITYNPWSKRETCQSLLRVLLMPRTECLARFSKDLGYCEEFSLHRFAREFIEDAIRVRKKESKYYEPMGFGASYRFVEIDRSFHNCEIQEVVESYRQTKRRVLFFDFEGTITHRTLDRTKQLIPERILHDIKFLSSNRDNFVMIVSGRKRSFLEQWFGSIPNLGLISEHGYYYKIPSSENEWRCLSQKIDDSWKTITLLIMGQYARRTQGSSIENKGSAMVFRCGEVEAILGTWIAQELSQQLRELLSKYPVEVSLGDNFVEVRLQFVNKGIAVSRILKQIESEGEIDFILCCGDDHSDEKAFESIHEFVDSKPKTNLEEKKQEKFCQQANLLNSALSRDRREGRDICYTLMVGKKSSCARQYLDNSNQVTLLIHALANQKTS